MATKTAPMFDMDFSKFASAFKLPNVNVQAVMAAQRKNLEALASANKAALEGVQEITRRQSEIFTESVEDASNALSDIMGVTSFEDRAVKQAEFTKDSYQKALANFWDLGEMVTKSNSRTFGVINKRVAEGLDEVKSMVSTKGAAPAA